MPMSVCGRPYGQVDGLEYYSQRLGGMLRGSRKMFHRLSTPEQIDTFLRGERFPCGSRETFSAPLQDGGVEEVTDDDASDDGHGPGGSPQGRDPPPRLKIQHLDETSSVY
jgi:hypothetical protein